MEKIISESKGEFTISTDKSLFDLRMIHQFLSEKSYWAKNISFEKLKRSFDHSLTFGVFHNGTQVGYAKVVTDYATIAYVGDVFILEQYRGKGLSKWLMQAIVSHPSLQGLRRMVLATADAHKLYEQFGFKGLAKPERWMELHDEKAYL